MQPKPIPPEVRELFDYLAFYADTGNLGVIASLDKRTHETRWVLYGRHIVPGSDDHEVTLVPLGFLSTTAGDEVIPPGLEPVAEFDLAPDRYEEFLLAQEVEVDRWADDGGACVH
jgi:hypothetical protein